MADSDHEWKASSNVPIDDISTAGGAVSSTLLTGATVGEILTRLKAKASGTPDNAGDIRQQWQKLFSCVKSSASESIFDGCYYIGNGLTRPSGAGQPKLTTTADESGKVARFIGPNNAGTAIIVQDVTLTSTPGDHSPASNMAWIERVQIRDADTGAPAVLAAAAAVKVGADTVGSIRAGLGWATGEVQLATVASVSDSGTTTNRRTAPGGLTFYRAYTLAAARYVRADSGNATLAPGEEQGIWLQQTLQPGMPAFNGVKLDLRVNGAWG